MLLIDRAPVEHYFTVLLDDDGRDLADNEELKHIDGHREDEEELDLFACLLRLKVQSVFVRGEHHGGQHLEDSTLQVAEALQLVAPRVGDDICEHDGEGPP